MRIERLEVERFSLKPPIPFTVAYASFPTLDYVLLKVHADNGLVGLGEAAPVPEVTGETLDSAVHILESAAPGRVGQDPFQAGHQGSRSLLAGLAGLGRVLLLPVLDIRSRPADPGTARLQGGVPVRE